MTSRKPKSKEIKTHPLDEILINEESDGRPSQSSIEKVFAEPKQPARKVIETKTVTYDEPVVVEEPDDDDDESSFDEKPSYRKAKSERTKAKERWQKRRGASSGLYRVRIDRLPSFEMNGQTGVNAERKFVKMVSSCTGKFIDDEEYLETIRGMIQTGHTQPGAFWIQILDSQGIVDQWAEFIDGQLGVIQNSQPITAIPDPANPGQVIVQVPAQQQVVPIDPFAEIDKTLQMMNRMRKAFGIEVAQNPTPPKTELSPEQQLAATLLLDPDVKRKAVRNLLGSNGSDGEKDLTTIVFEHAPAIIETLGSVIQRIMADFRGGQNGIAQMASQNVSAYSIQNKSQHQNGQNAFIQGVRQGAAFNQSNRQGYSDTTEQPAHQESVSPEDQLLTYLLSFVVNQCAAQSDPGDTVDSVFQWINETDDVHPFLRPALLKTIKDVSELDIESVIAFVRLQPNGETVTSLPHAKTWFESLQAEIKKVYSGGEASGN